MLLEYIPSCSRGLILCGVAASPVYSGVKSKSAIMSCGPRWNQFTYCQSEVFAKSAICEWLANSSLERVLARSILA
eukprot:9380696-Lingulodinium_polyedra.AAC.1